MPYRTGKQIFRFMDLALYLRYSKAKNEERYFIELNGSGRSYNVEELLYLRNKINAELYRVGRLKDPAKVRDAWNRKHKFQKTKAEKAYRIKHADKVRQWKRDYYNRQKEIEAAKKRAVEAQTIKNINVRVITAGGTHEVPEAETERTLPAN